MKYKIIVRFTGDPSACEI